VWRREARDRRGFSARSIRLGRKPAKVLPPPVGATSNTLSLACAVSINASWCGRAVQPFAANQSWKQAGSMGDFPMRAGRKARIF
jgi:hypothetical protein